MHSTPAPTHYGLYAACALAGVSLTANACALMAVEDEVKTLKRAQKELNISLGNVQSEFDMSARERTIELKNERIHLQDSLAKTREQCDKRMFEELDAVRAEHKAVIAGVLKNANKSFNTKLNEHIRVVLRDKTVETTEELARMNARINDVEEYNRFMIHTLHRGPIGNLGRDVRKLENADAN